MFSELRPYEANYEVGFPWLGQTPSDWRVVRAKSVLDTVDRRSADGTEDLLTVSSRRGVVRRSTADVSMFQAATYAGHKLCWPGDLVINSLWAWGGGLGVSPVHGIVSTAYGVYRPRSSSSGVLKSEYLHHLVRSTPFQWELQTRSRGVWKSRLQLTDASFLDAPLLVPPLQTQELIVKYLAHAHRRVDRAIDAKRKMIALLAEQKQWSIEEALIGRTGRDMPAIGDIPVGSESLDHADTVRLGSLASLIQTGPFGSQLHAEEYIDNGVPIVNPSHMVDGWIKPDPSVTVSEAKAAELRRHKLEEGDLVVARRGELGRCALVTAEQRGWVCGTGSLIVRVPRNTVLPEYLRLRFSSRSLRLTLESQSIGSTMPNLNAKMIGRLSLPLPSVGRQRDIIAFAESRSEVADIAIDRARREIQLLEEFRTRLTSDVVTGQVDVRDIAARLPDIDPADVVRSASKEPADASVDDEAIEELEEALA